MDIKLILADFFKKVIIKLIVYFKVAQVPLEKNLKYFSDTLNIITKDSDIDILIGIDITTAQVLSNYISSKTLKIIDINEFPLLEYREGKLFKKMSRLQLSCFQVRIKESLCNLDDGISVSNAISKITYNAYKYRTIPIINIRNSYKQYNKKNLKQMFNLDSTAKLLVHPATYAKEYGSDDLLYVMQKLPKNYHVLMIGNAANDDYDKDFKLLLNKLKLKDRIHFINFISSEEEYINYLHSCDLGLVFLKPKSQMIRFGFANRFGDLLSAQISIISSNIPEVNTIINKYGIGKVVGRWDINLFAEAIEEWFAKKDKKTIRDRKHAWKEIAKTLSWEHESKRVYDIIKSGDDRSSNIVIVFPRGLVKNRRVMRLAKVCSDRGDNVLVISGVHPNMKMIEGFEDIDFLSIPFNRKTSPRERTLLKNFIIEWNLKKIRKCSNDKT